MQVVAFPADEICSLAFRFWHNLSRQLQPTKWSGGPGGGDGKQASNGTAWHRAASYCMHTPGRRRAQRGMPLPHKARELCQAPRPPPGLPRVD
jgi:hypothetical protein